MFKKQWVYVCQEQIGPKYFIFIFYFFWKTVENCVEAGDEISLVNYGSSFSEAIDGFPVKSLT